MTIRSISTLKELGLHQCGVEDASEIINALSVGGGPLNLRRLKISNLCCHTEDLTGMAKYPKALCRN